MHFLKSAVAFLSMHIILLESSSLKIKRNVIHPSPGAKVQLIFGAGFPVAIEDPSITMGYVIKCDYRLPKNISDYIEPEVISSKKKRDISLRWKMYSIIAYYLENFGGKSCVLRAICEMADNSLDKKYGFMDEILHSILTPSITQEYIGDPLNREYLAAEHIGKTKSGKCSFFFPECALNLIDLFTKWM